MPNYVICTRNIVGAKFGDEPGDATFLILPDDANISLPTHKTKKDTFLKRFLGNKDISDVIIFIHGYNNSIKDVITRHKNVKEGLAQAGYKGELISFDWPSSDKTLMYLEDRHDAKKTAMELVSSGIALLAIQQGTGCTLNVHTIAHSTGAYVIKEAFDDSDTTSSTAEINWTISQMVFISGDVSSDSMSPKYSESLYRRCNRFTNYYNPHDSILAISNAKRVGFKNRAGRIGLPGDVPAKAVDVNCGAYYNANKDKIKVKVGAPSHSWYFYSKEWFADVLQTIQGSVDRNVISTRGKDEEGKLMLKL